MSSTVLRTLPVRRTLGSSQSVIEHGSGARAEVDNHRSIALMPSEGYLPLPGKSSCWYDAPTMYQMSGFLNHWPLAFEMVSRRILRRHRDYRWVSPAIYITHRPRVHLSRSQTTFIHTESAHWVDPPKRAAPESGSMQSWTPLCGISHLAYENSSLIGQHLPNKYPPHSMIIGCHEPHEPERMFASHC